MKRYLGGSRKVRVTDERIEEDKLLELMCGHSMVGCVEGLET
jgi:hypothetical protein